MERWWAEPLPFFAVLRFSDGAASWVMALSENKNGSFKCRVVSEFSPHHYRKAKQEHVDFKSSPSGSWKVLTLEQLPAGVRDRLVGA